MSEVEKENIDSDGKIHIRIYDIDGFRNLMYAEKSSGIAQLAQDSFKTRIEIFRGSEVHSKHEFYGNEEIPHIIEKCKSSFENLADKGLVISKPSLNPLKSACLPSQQKIYLGYFVYLLTSVLLDNFVTKGVKANQIGYEANHLQKIMFHFDKDQLKNEKWALEPINKFLRDLTETSHPFGLIQLDENWEITRERTESIEEYKKEILALKAIKKTEIDNKIDDEVENRFLEAEIKRKQDEAKRIKQHEQKLEAERIARKKAEAEKKEYEKWIKKRNKVLTIVFSIILVAFAIVVINQFTSPFSKVFKIVKDKTIKTHIQYPKFSENASVLFHFPNEVIESKINRNGQIALNKIDHRFRNSKIQVDLIDPYWKFIKDSLVINDDETVILKIQPNEKLSEIKGTIRDIFGNPLISATIEHEEIVAKTDSLGMFLISVPIDKRKKQYDIVIKKKGYNSQMREYLCGDGIEVRLEKEDINE